MKKTGALLAVLIVGASAQAFAQDNWDGPGRGENRPEGRRAERGLQGRDQDRQRPAQPELR